MNFEAKKRFLINFSYISITAFLIFVSGKFLFSYLLPFEIASLIAWSVRKPAKYLGKKLRIKTKITAPFLAALVYVFLAFCAILLIYRISIAFGDLFDNMTDILDFATGSYSKFQNQTADLLNQISPSLSEKISNIETDIINNFIYKITGAFSSFATKAAKGTPSFLFSSIVTLVSSCFIAKDFEGLLKFISSLCGKTVYKKVLRIKDIFRTSVLSIIKGYFLLMLITFCELTVLLLIARVKYAPVFAFIIALIDLLPVLGTGTVLIPWSIFEFLTHNTKAGVLLLLSYSVITLIRYFAEPKIIGDKIGINPLFTLLSMFVGIKLFGFAGIFILPITLIVVIKYYKTEP